MSRFPDIFERAKSRPWAELTPRERAAVASFRNALEAEFGGADPAAEADRSMPSAPILRAWATPSDGVSTGGPLA